MPPVRVRFVGSGDAFASGGRFHPCIHLDGGSEPMLIDCGATSLTALKRQAIDPASIGLIALSHLHGDHFAGIPWVILDGQFSGRRCPLVIAGPPTTQDRLGAAFEALYPGSSTTERPFEVTFVELPARTPQRLGPATITAFEVIHRSGAPSYALRVEYADRVIAYSGDTEWTDALQELARDADLFICECNFFEPRAPGHLDYQTLASKLPALTSKCVVLTHMSDEMLAHLDEVELETAEDGAAIEL